MKTSLTMAALSLSVGVVFSASASASAATTLFTNVDVFNGTEDKLYQDHYVLVEDNLITQVSADPIEAKDAVVIDGQGLTMTPGLMAYGCRLSS